MRVDKSDLTDAAALPEEQFLVRVQNLHRLELIVHPTAGGIEPVRGFRRSRGRLGHRACPAPRFQAIVEGMNLAD